MGVGDSSLLIKDLEEAQSKTDEKERDQLLRKIFKSADKNKTGYWRLKRRRIFSVLYMII